MSVNNNYDLMKQSFLESKDIINEIFTYLNAPDYYFVQHMTFDELVTALYRLLGIYKNIYGNNPPHLEYIVDTYDANATSEDILFNKTAYVKGEKIEGNIVSYPEHTYIPTTIDIVIPEHHYLDGNQTIKGDTNLIPENIKPGITIFNVTNPEENAYVENDIVLDQENPEQPIAEGWHKQGLIRIQFQERNVTPSQEQQLITPDDHHVLSRVIVEGDDDLLSENIKKDATIFGVPGSIYVLDTQNGDALAKEIVSGKIAYVQGQEVVGTMPHYDLGDIILSEENATQHIEEGYHESANIKIQTQEKYAHPTIHEQIIEPDDDHVLSRVFVDGDEDLLPQNIKKGVIIFDVVGELEEYNKYNIVYVVNVPKQTAYLQQVECGKQFAIIGTTPSLDDYEFKGWSNDANADTVMYQSGQLVTNDLADKGEACILYAVLEETDLPEITLDVTYQNGGRIANGQEIATVTVHGGNLSTGYANVQRDLQCDDAIFISKFANETSNTYTNQLKFNDIGFYPIIVIHKHKNKQVSATEVIKVAGENGSMSGEGTMKFETNPTVSYFDSGWVSANIIKGCWIKGYTYNYQSGGGHGSIYDELAVFGKTSSGKTILLYDFGNTTNLKREITLNNITGADIYNNGSYKLSLGSFSLTNGDLSSTLWNITDTFTKSDDIRQLRFFASSDHDASCFSAAHIDYDIQYDFDMDLWETDKNSSNSSNSSNTQIHQHSYNYVVTTPATCGTDGLKTGTCSCGQTVTEPIKATNRHSYDSGIITTQATCANAGTKTYTCTVCGKTKTSSIAKLTTHSYDAGTVTKEPTTTKTGVKTYTCTVCGKTKTETIPRLVPDTSVNISQDRDFSGKWGWYTIRDNDVQKELYKRIYNAHVNNGQEKTIKYTNFSTGEVQTCDALFNSSDKFKGYLYIPLDDLNITDIDDVWYVNGIVEQDCPELLWKWQASNPAVCHRANGIPSDLCLCHYSISEKNTKQSKIESTFNEICNFVQTYYDITYVENTFANNNTYYSELQKKQIAKVIHDFLEVNNHYGDTSDPENNQNVYAALSKGASHPICASYSQAFKYCCERWGISCICAVGHAYNGTDGNHAWNMVSYKQKNPGALANNNSAWQEVDCTWDDPSNYKKLNQYLDAGITAEMLTNACKWDHFNVTTAEINAGITVKEYRFPNGAAFTSHTAAGRRKDLFGSADDNDGLPDVGVYTSYPTGTCSTNKYNGANGIELYTGF